LFQSTVKQTKGICCRISEELGVRTNLLMAQLREAGVKKESPKEIFSVDDKVELLRYLRKKHEKQKSHGG
jgi:cobalamin biosynthesis protein CbiG